MQCTDKKYSLWLCPATIFETAIQNQISVLTDTLSSPAFKPHITLCSQITGDPILLTEEMLNFATNNRAISIQPTEFAFTTDFYKSLYIKVEKCRSLLKLQRESLKYLEPGEVRPFDPHISLAYKRASEFDAKEIIATLDTQLLNSMLFNRVALIETSGEIKDWYVASEAILT